jgi:hydroxymethylpyrimidine/phosphomethylpyrimidine kinase
MPDKDKNISLTIAGFDPCGGAGVLADIQTMQQCGIDGMAVLTAITYQNEENVFGLEWCTFESIRQQLLPLVNYPIAFVKIGIVQNLTTLSLVVNFVTENWPQAKIIWDPILKSSSGFDFLVNLEVSFLEEILKKIYLITPNKDEYEVLKVCLAKIESANVLIKGGHASDDDTSDRLINMDGSETILKGKRIVGYDKHGTGCILSAAITAALCKGMTLQSACQMAKQYIEQYLISNKGKLGKHYLVTV